MMWLSASFASKCTVFTVNLYYLQVLAKYKKVLCKTKSVMDSVFLSVFLYWWFSFDLHFSVTKIFVNSVESGTSEKFISCDYVWNFEKWFFVTSAFIWYTWHSRFIQYFVFFLYLLVKKRFFNLLFSKWKIPVLSTSNFHSKLVDTTLLDRKFFQNF